MRGLISVTEAIIMWEEGALDEEGEVSLFQLLIDDGTVWKLQGVYGRTAQALIEAGLCHA